MFPPRMNNHFYSSLKDSHCHILKCTSKSSPYLLIFLLCFRFSIRNSNWFDISVFINVSLFYLCTVNSTVQGILLHWLSNTNITLCYVEGSLTIRSVVLWWENSYNNRLLFSREWLLRVYYIVPIMPIFWSPYNLDSGDTSKSPK